MREPRLYVGMWQVSGGHGRIDPERAIASMRAHVDAGFTTFDLADHYGPAEDLVGELRRRLRVERGEPALGPLRFHTKWVPEPGPMTRSIVEAAIDVSRRRMDMDVLDSLQFHWWDYGDRRYLDALRHLTDVRTAGKIRDVALTNFDTRRVEEILDAGVPVVSNQVQYSLVDRRPERAMSALCAERGVVLHTYGTVAGGLFAERFLGAPEPGRAVLATASLQKYKRMIDAWGDWQQFQDLLETLDGIAKKHVVSIAAVAMRAILDRPAVGAVIFGARLGESEHLATNLKIGGLVLDAADREQIDSASTGARDLISVIGDCGDEYR